MWLTISAIGFFICYQYFLFRRRRYFFLHSLFLIPLHATVFFIDHNVSKVVSGLEVDSVAPVIKMMPVYATTFMLFQCRAPRRPPLYLVPTGVINFFMVWMFVATLVSAILFRSFTPVFIVSFTVPVFWVFFNSENISSELAAKKEAPMFDKRMLQIYFIGFVLVYILGIYYSIAAGITSSLLDSRSVGSIFASTSAVVYCVLFAPLLCEFAGVTYPYWIMGIVATLSLSKTALLLLPAASLGALELFRRHLNKHKIKYILMLFVCFGGLVFFMHTQIFDVLSGFWGEKFALDGRYNSIFEKAYFTRMKIYQVALDLIVRYPTGVGMGNFELFQQWGFKDAHNFILTTLVENGWLAGTSFLLVLFFVFLKCAWIFIKRRKTSYLGYTLITVLLIYFTSSGVLATTGYPDISVIYYTPLYGAAIFSHLNVFLKKKVA